ncbi:hypothetical protein K3495_g2784 [Podosphaera aphanis]|nr:hypothetical protein K3495_g2784 [Podosphaera aphanis]
MSTSDILKSLRHAPRLSKSTFVRWSYPVEQVLTNLYIDKYISQDFPGIKTENTDSKTQDNPFKDQDGNIKVALVQLVPEETFYLIHGKSTSKEMWDALLEYYRPMCRDTVASLLQDFWGFTMNDGVDVDKFAEELIQRQTKIASIDSTQRPSDSIMKSRLLNHFDRTNDGYFCGTITVLRNDPSISFSGAVNSLRATQQNYDSRRLNPITSLMNDEDMGLVTKSSDHKGKLCNFCNRTNHTRETCFAWLDTPDGSKWASRNPEKAAKTLRLKEK